MKVSKLWQIIITVALVLGLWMPSVMAGETLSPQTDRFNGLLKECLQLEGEQSLRACDQAIELYPDDIMVWYGRSRLLSALGQEEGANKSYARVQVLQGYHDAIAQLLGQWQQLESLMNNEEDFSQLEAAINSEDTQAEQLERLKDLKQQILTFRENPTVLDQKMADAMIQIRDRLGDIIEQITATTTSMAAPE